MNSAPNPGHRIEKVVTERNIPLGLVTLFFTAALAENGFEDVANGDYLSAAGKTIGVIIGTRFGVKKTRGNVYHLHHHQPRVVTPQSPVTPTMPNLLPPPTIPTVPTQLVAPSPITQPIPNILPPPVITNTQPVPIILAPPHP